MQFRSHVLECSLHALGHSSEMRGGKRAGSGRPAASSTHGLAQGANPFAISQAEQAAAEVRRKERVENAEQLGIKSPPLKTPHLPCDLKCPVCTKDQRKNFKIF